MTTEKDIERYLVRKVAENGGKAYKFSSPGNAGVPDRIIIWPGRKCAFAELKAPGRKMRPLQVKAAEGLERMGFPVACINSKEGADLLIEALKTGEGLHGYGWRDDGTA